MKYLLIDIGAGTMDVLYYDSETESFYKAVCLSPTIYLAQKIAGIRGELLVTGREMGGGPVSAALIRHAADNDLVMSMSASSTIHHDPDRVRSYGIKLVEDYVAEDLKNDDRYVHVTLEDIELDRISHIIKGMGVPFMFDVIGICAQDHGVPPKGMSHLDYRHNIFKEILEKNPYPHAMLYKWDEVPHTMNRLSSIAESAKKFPAEEIYVMDSGMAAILGASLDSLASRNNQIMVLDIATSHTVGAALAGGEIFGFFEYHTKDITLERLETLLTGLADGELEHKKILDEGGHGAYIRKHFGFRNTDIIIATGPKRVCIEDSVLAVVMGAPLGDNMMTGTAGVLEAIRKNNGKKR